MSPEFLDNCSLYKVRQKGSFNSANIYSCEQLHWSYCGPNSNILCSACYAFSSSCKFIAPLYLKLVVKFVLFLVGVRNNYWIAKCRLRKSNRFVVKHSKVLASTAAACWGECRRNMSVKRHAKYLSTCSSFEEFSSSCQPWKKKSHVGRWLYPSWPTCYFTLFSLQRFQHYQLNSRKKKKRKKGLTPFVVLYIHDIGE